MRNITEISNIIIKLKKANEIEQFFGEIFTQNELETLSKRWRILNMLKEGKTQRAIAQELNVSLCKVTRAAKILKNKNAIIRNILIKD